jgi:molybdopterin molybdotransferase
VTAAGLGAHELGTHELGAHELGARERGGLRVQPRHAASLAWDEASAIAGGAAEPLPAVGRELTAAVGHALALPLEAMTDLPPFDTSAMDGWAVRGPGPWRIAAARVLAGSTPEPLAAGDAVPIATGAEVPAGATAVLRREDGEVGPPGGVLYDQSSAPLALGRDIRTRGQECRRGDKLLPSGSVVTPAVVALAAAAGYDVLRVHPRPVVDLLVLGDELLSSGLPHDGRIRDALGPMLPPLLAHAGAEVTAARRVGDDLTALAREIERSCADVVVTTGSTAAGPRDFLHQALALCGGRLLVDSVSVRPGHPMLLARLPDRDGPPRHLVGLPGNPLAAIAGTLTLAVPLVRRLGGRRERLAARQRVAHALPGHPRDTRLCPVAQTDDGVAPLPFDGPAMLRGVALADGLAVVPPGGLLPGESVEVLPLSRD